MASANVEKEATVGQEQYTMHPTDQAADTQKTDALIDEKMGAKYSGENEEVEFEKADDNIVTIDPFVPFNDLPDERHWIVTFRAMLVGIICGALVNASNLYLGLKTGWTFTANLFGAIVGFSVLKSLAKALPNNFPLLGGDFGPRENNIVQTAATAAGGLSSVFVSGIPALYRLKLLSDNPADDFGRLCTLTIVGGYFGFAFATPLRKFFIIYVARELRLIFPTPSATSMTIRSMHGAVSGEMIAKMKMKALSIAFSISFVLRVVSQYAPGILWDWHIFTWFYIWGNYNNSAMAVESWGWFIEWTPAFIGAGILVGLNTSISFFMGSVLAWGIIGPTLVTTGTAFGYSYPIAAGIDPSDTAFYDKWGSYTYFWSLGAASVTKTSFSPRFWMLWPGVLLMIAVSFTELALQYRVFIYIGKAVWRASNQYASFVMRKLGKPSPKMEERANKYQEVLVEDICPDDQLVQWWMWFPLLVLMVILFCVVLAVQFDLPVGMAILALFLAFFFSFLAVQCAGVTDITPLTAASKASQLVLGGATKGEGWSVPHAQRLNLIGGSLASMGANQASDLVSDFRVGFLLRTSPKQQWLAQGIASMVAVFLAPGLFILFVKAYPCVLDDSATVCPFPGPSIAAWEAVTVAITADEFPVPTSSGIFAIVLAVFGSFMIFVRHYLYRGRFEKYRVWHPNMMCIGLAFVLNATIYGTAMLMGSILAFWWAKKSPRKFDIYGYAVAAGMIAGEGIGGVINAIFQIANIAGPSPYGTNIACPGDSC